MAKGRVFLCVCVQAMISDQIHLLWSRDRLGFGRRPAVEFSCTNVCLRCRECFACGPCQSRFETLCPCCHDNAGGTHAVLSPVTLTFTRGVSPSHRPACTSSCGQSRVSTIGACLARAPRNIHVGRDAARWWVDLWLIFEMNRVISTSSGAQGAR